MMGKISQAVAVGLILAVKIRRNRAILFIHFLVLINIIT